MMEQNLGCFHLHQAWEIRKIVYKKALSYNVPKKLYTILYNEQWTIMSM